MSRAVCSFFIITKMSDGEKVFERISFIQIENKEIIPCDTPAP